MITNNNLELMADSDLVNLGELEEAEYIGSFEHQGRICDYYSLVNQGETTFFYIVRAEQ